MDIGKLFSESWNRFSANLVSSIIVVVVGSLVGSLLAGFTAGIAGIPVFVGIVKAMRRVQQGGTADFGDLFSEFSNFGKWFMVWVVALVAGLASVVTFGLASIVIPFVLAFMVPLMLERDMAAFDAAKESFNYVKDNLGLVFVPLLLTMIVSGLGGAVFGIGALITVPLAMIANWYIYDWSIGGGAPAAASAAAAPAAAMDDDDDFGDED
ncbi:hypothetical protein KDL29_12765 [bacterium]|nr:hypothetical protein [bacterium]UNM09307.1 MAG: hypothetical protein H7A35_04445 [Planctomycetales bacterium]